MISIARTLGAPLSVPAGKVATSASKALWSSRSSPTTVDTMCMTWLYRSMVANSGTSTRARLADPAEIVAAEVDEHDVLGPFLRVGEQLAGEARVLLRRGAAPAGAGDRVQQGAPSGDLEVRLGRRTDDVESVKAEQIHVRAGVGGPQHPVDVQRVGVGRSLEALGDNDLEALAGPDVLLGRLDGLGVKTLGGTGDEAPDTRVVHCGDHRRGGP